MTRPELLSGHIAKGLFIGAVAIAVESAVVAGLKQFVSPASLTGLDLFAVLPVAIGWGFWLAGIVAVASYLTFAFFFVSPLHSFRIADSDTEAPPQSRSRPRA
jgi:K+-sensing histidine kinase KdpD